MDSQPPGQGNPGQGNPGQGNPGQGNQDPVLATPVERGPSVSPKPRRRTRPMLLLMLILLMGGLVISLLLNMVMFGVSGLTAFESDRKVQEKFVSHQKHARNKIAIISIKGVIMDAEGFVKRQIDRAKSDQSVKAVVLRVDSPGGSVSASDAIYHQLRELVEGTHDPENPREVPLVVSMGGMAASGGYYVSMACGDEPDVIFAEPTTSTGSIGVIMPHYNFAGLMEEWGIEEDAITSHRLKNMGSFSKPMTAEERKIFQELVDEFFAQFKDAVKHGRPKFEKDTETLDELATGQVFTGRQAEKNGLVDKVGFLDEAVERAIELAGIEKDDVKVIQYKREPNLADVLMGAQARRPSLDLATMLEMTSPRAYYLCTWLPSLSSNP